MWYPVRVAETRHTLQRCRASRQCVPMQSMGTRQERRSRPSRRAFVGMAGAGLGLFLAGSVRGDEATPETVPGAALKEGDRVELDRPAAEIIEEAYRLGHDYEKRHGGCCRCTLAAVQDAVPFVPVEPALFRAASCLDGGATPVAVQNCGAFTGSGIVIGHLTGGITRQGGEFRGGTGLAHRLLHRVYDRFKEAYGTVLCRDVRKGAEGDCPEVCGRAARWVAEVLLEEFAGWKPPAVEPEDGNETPQEAKPAPAQPEEQVS